AVVHPSNSYSACAGGGAGLDDEGTAAGARAVGGGAGRGRARRLRRQNTMPAATGSRNTLKTASQMSAFARNSAKTSSTPSALPRVLPGFHGTACAVGASRATGSSTTVTG